MGRNVYAIDSTKRFHLSDERFVQRAFPNIADTGERSGRNGTIPHQTIRHRDDGGRIQSPTELGQHRCIRLQTNRDSLAKQRAKLFFIPTIQQVVRPQSIESLPTLFLQGAHYRSASAGTVTVYGHLEPSLSFSPRTSDAPFKPRSNGVPRHSLYFGFSARSIHSQSADISSACGCIAGAMLSTLSILFSLHIWSSSSASFASISCSAFRL